jgi:enamine deaminase RidA (YjgF/YER057c/UK114 family)
VPRDGRARVRSRIVVAMSTAATDHPGARPAHPADVRRINPTTWSLALGYDQGQLRSAPQAILTIAGQGPTDERGRLLHEGDVAAQLALAMANVEAVLDEAGMALADLASLRVHVTDIAAALAVHDTVVEHLSSHGATPPTTVVEVNRLAVPGMAVQIDGLAIR